MPVVVDGNNLLFAGRDADPEQPISRSRLCRLLGDWAQRTGERVHVVFDGPEPRGSLGEQIRDPQIDVTFSGVGVSADDVLTEMIRTDSAAKRLVVVSSDRAIARVAKRRRASPMRSDDFWQLVLADLARPQATPFEPLEKRRGMSPGQAADWLRDFGFE